MAMTLRNQNVCTSCNHTWFPRGHDVSHRCPRCSSSAVSVVQEEKSEFWDNFWIGVGVCLVPFFVYGFVQAAADSAELPVLSTPTVEVR